MMRFASYPVVIALALCSSALQAEDAAGTTEAKTEKSIVTGRLGVGPLLLPTYSGSADYRVWPVPLADLEFGDYAYLYYWEAGLYVFATKDRDLGIAIVATPRIGYDSSDGDRLTGMMTRKSSLELGLSVDYRLGAGGVSLGYLYDVTGASSGGVIRLAGLHRFEVTQSLGVDLLLEAEWLSSKVANYYFGVTASEATATRPTFHPGSGSDFTVGLHFNYDFGTRSTILFGYEGQLLGGPISDSPIVVTRLNNLLYVGYGWRF